MALLDLLILTMLISGGFFGSWLYRSTSQARDREEARLVAMLKELREALSKKDYAALEGMLIVYADLMPKSTQELVRQRCAELYVENNP